MPNDMPKKLIPCTNANDHHISQPTITAHFHSQPCAVRNITAAILFIKDRESNSNADTMAGPKGMIKKQIMASGNAQASVQKLNICAMDTKRIHVRFLIGRVFMYESIIAESEENINFDMISGKSIDDATIGIMFSHFISANKFHVLSSIPNKTLTITTATRK